MNEAVTLAIIGFLSLMVSAVVVGLFKIIQSQNDNQKMLANSLDANTESNRRIADEARERNGHLAEITIQSRDQIIEVVTHVKKQHVGTQEVDKQEIKGDV